MSEVPEVQEMQKYFKNTHFTTHFALHKAYFSVHKVNLYSLYKNKFFKILTSGLMSFLLYPGIMHGYYFFPVWHFQVSHLLICLTPLVVEVEDN